MAKVNVSIPDGLLAEIDSLASDLHRSRSGLVQEAAALYVTDMKAERARIAREQRILQAMDGMREIARQLGPCDPATAIRADRDGDHGHDRSSSPRGDESDR
jgi:Arc/MetJ-type ribon-helix-helix transcriptional regulator